MSELFNKVVKECTGLEAVSEYKFHPTRKWRFDYCILSEKIAIEVEGGIFTRGRHTRGVGYKNDLLKYNEAARLGYRLIRVTPDLLLTSYTIKLIEDLAGISVNNNLADINLN